MADINKDIRLKDVNGNYLYPLARRDFEGELFREKYVVKTGEDTDSYISNVKVETYIDPTTQAEIQKLTLINKQDPEHPIEFLGGDGGYAAWGFITGNIGDQGDLNFLVNNKITLAINQKNKIFRQATVPVGSESVKLIPGDLWYVTGDIEGYNKGKWYVYQENAQGEGYWEETTDTQIKENTTKISVEEGRISTEISDRKAGEAKTYSTIEQTSKGIKSEVGVTRTRFFKPASEPPRLSEECIVENGDLWYCSSSSAGYEVGKWYICKDITKNEWELATEEQYASTTSKIEQNAESIRSEVTRATEAEGTLSGRITVNADNISAEVTRATDAEEELSGKITVEADRITSEVTRATEAEGTLGSKIEQTEESLTSSIKGVDDKYSVVQQTVDGWSFKTTSGETVINGSKIKTGIIDADTVNITGTLKSAYIEADHLKVAGKDIGDNTSSVNNLYTKKLYVSQAAEADNPEILLSKGSAGRSNSLLITDQIVKITNVDGSTVEGYWSNIITNVAKFG